jgi:hypothetical protein
MPSHLKQMQMPEQMVQTLSPALPVILGGLVKGNGLDLVV